MEQRSHIAILPSPGMGHLIPMAEFAKQLVKHHHISATIMIPTTGPPPKAQISILESLPENIKHVFLPPVNGLPKGVRPEITISFVMQASFSSVRDTLSSLKSNTKLVALVFDMFGHDYMEVAKEFNLFSFLFFPMSAMALSFTFLVQKLDEESSCEYKDLPYPVNVPGSVSFHGRDLMAPVQVRTDKVYKGYLLLSKRLALFDGIMVNSFEELEEETFRVLRGGAACKTPIYPIGPLIRSDPSDGSDRHESLKWLDNQPDESVVLVSFGSGGTLSFDQVHELAHGLEASGQRFLWIVRSPDKSSNASFFNSTSQDDPLGFLPEGFLARTEKRGLVVPSWAPQIEILSHEAVGGFLTHCGWNSTLESIVHGVPMIAWPLYAEQHMNAKVMTEALCLALRAEVDENGVVRKEVIEKVLKELMEGEEGKKVSKRLKELKFASMKALSIGGSSMESLSKIALQLNK
ncbi:UDP-glucuronosyl/UDP-glucosyltransferase [Artemisia annua]|uniref:Glycosyltransferase n=1 Tax=Artemisia annua TaxID=35608 RepID=A0A2U1P2Z4_ARTAN|nr:UDP-glucuronosyl/UDP-glucosyltransferase [Artemisia annua]